MLVTPEARPLPFSKAIISHGDHDKGSREFQTLDDESRGSCVSSNNDRWQGCEFHPIWRKSSEAQWVRRQRDMYWL